MNEANEFRAENHPEYEKLLEQARELLLFLHPTVQISRRLNGTDSQLEATIQGTTLTLDELQKDSDAYSEDIHVDATIGTHQLSEGGPLYLSALISLQESLLAERIHPDTPEDSLEYEFAAHSANNDAIDYLRTTSGLYVSYHAIDSETGNDIYVQYTTIQDATQKECISSATIISDTDLFRKTLTIEKLPTNFEGATTLQATEKTDELPNFDLAAVAAVLLRRFGIEYESFFQEIWDAVKTDETIADQKIMDILALCQDPEERALLEKALVQFKQNARSSIFEMEEELAVHFQPTSEDIRSYEALLHRMIN